MILGMINDDCVNTDWGWFMTARLTSIASIAFGCCHPGEDSDSIPGAGVIVFVAGKSPIKSIKHGNIWANIYIYRTIPELND
jgi:hypothetical protein